VGDCTFPVSSLQAWNKLSLEIILFDLQSLSQSINQSINQLTMFIESFKITIANVFRSFSQLKQGLALQATQQPSPSMVLVDMLLSLQSNFYAD